METIPATEALNEALRERIIAEVDAQFDAQTAFLESLVREPSVRGNTNGAQAVVARQLRSQGLEVAEETIDPERLVNAPGYAPVDWSYDGLVNVVGRRRAAGSGGRSLVLNGHIDVVSPEPRSFWTRDPFGALIEGDRMYGRGAFDMKGGVASMIFALDALRSAGIGLRGDVMVQTVFDEECSGNATLALVDRGYLGDAVIIPEPTGQTVVSAYVGVIWARITVRGRVSHVRATSEAVNAAEKTYDVIRSLRELETECNRQPNAAFGSIAHPINLNIGMVHAGDWPSTVPGLAELFVRFAFYPDESVADAQARFRAHLAAFSRTDPWLKDHPLEIEFIGFAGEGIVHDLDHEFYRLLGAHHRQIIGTELRAEPQSCIFDGHYFSRYERPVAIYGLTGGDLHAPNEWVSLSSMREVTCVIALATAQWCGVAV